MVDSLRSAGDPDMNRSRFFGSTRTVLIVRFDPGIADPYETKDVRDERNPDPFVASSKRAQFRKLTNRTSSLSRAQLRDVITSARTNLGDALAKFPRLDGLTRIFDLSPRQSVRRVNGYRKADELDLSFEWSAVPFDSRLIRAIFVLHYEGTVPAESWGTGIRERSPGSPSASGYLVPATGDNLRFVGTIDEVQDAHGDDGDELTMKGRDLTSLMIDATFPPILDVQLLPGATLLEAVRSVLDTNDLFDLIRGPFLRSEEPLPQLDAARYPRLAIPAKERHRKSKSGGLGYVLRRPPKGGKSSYWDVITDLCVSHGLRPMMDLDRLVLVEPRQLYKELPEEILSPGQLTFPTRYREQLGDAFPIRRMVYGVNVAALRFNRKLGKIKAPIVEVSSSNPDAVKASERLLVARHPPEKYRQLTQASKTQAKTANSVDATGTKPQAKVHIVQLHGIVDQTQLELVAKQIYEGMGRQELGVVIETDDVASFSDHPRFDPNEDPDLLAIRAGDPIRILVAPAQSERSQLYTLSDLQAMVSRARTAARGGAPEAPRAGIAYLVQQGWSKEDAAQFVKVLASANLPQEFRVFGASIAFDAEQGFNVQLDCRDYVRVRADPSDPTQTRSLKGEVPGAKVTLGAPTIGRRR